MDTSRWYNLNDHIKIVGTHRKSYRRYLPKLVYTVYRASVLICFTDKLIKVPISKKILFEGIAADSIINVDRAGEGLTFTVIELNIYAALENSSNSVDHNGYITVV